MSGIALDFTIDVPMLVGGAVFLFTVGQKLGNITNELKRIGKIADELPDLESRVSRIEGQLGAKVNVT